MNRTKSQTLPLGMAETWRNGNPIVPTGHFFIWVVSLFPAVNCRVILKHPYGIYFLPQQEFDISTKIS
ncbi:hypothetical protein, partial [Caldithrix abyssi]